jgi:hypothetical protein
MVESAGEGGGPMLWRMQLASLGAALVCVAVAQPALAASYVKPSDLSADRRHFESSEVQVRGWAYFGYPIGQIWDSETSYKRGILTQCISLVITDDALRNQFNRKTVTVVGKFESDILAGKIDFAVCDNAGVIVHKISHL